MPSTKDFTQDSWSAAAVSYTERVGRMSRLGADRLITLTNALRPFSVRDSYVLDNGAGTGALTSSLTSQFPSIRVLAADIAPGMLETIEEKHLPNVSTRVLDACVLDHSELKSGSFSHVLSTFMVQFTPTPQNVVREMYRVLQPSGVIGIGIWTEKNGPINIWADACRSLDPAYDAPRPYDDAAWSTAPEVEDALRTEGFRDVGSELFRMPFAFEDTAGFMRFWFEARNPVADGLVGSWRGELAEVKARVEKIVREEYEDGRGILLRRRWRWGGSEGVWGEARGSRCVDRIKRLLFQLDG